MHSMIIDFGHCLNRNSHLGCYASALPWWTWPALFAFLCLLVLWLLKKRLNRRFRDECEANGTTSEKKDQTLQYPAYRVRRKNFFGKKIGLYVRMPPGRKIELFAQYLEKYDVIFGMTLGAPIRGGGKGNDWYYLPRTDFGDVKKKGLD